jgi:hypothetical protein
MALPRLTRKLVALLVVAYLVARAHGAGLGAP